jgi:aspartate carbamoyltransferase catalytic subunit
LHGRDFLTLQGVSRDELKEILNLARACDTGLSGRPLAGKTVCLAFFEASTRTAVSFELAAKRAGADVLSISEKGSAIQKGESLIDTVVTLDALGADAVVIRHPSTGAARSAAKHTSAAVVNAGDGRGQHPTQALLDLYALSQALGGFDELMDKRVAILVGWLAAWSPPSGRQAWRWRWSHPPPSCPASPKPGASPSSPRWTTRSAGVPTSSTRCGYKENA